MPRSHRNLSRQTTQRTLLVFLFSGLIIAVLSWLAWNGLSDQRARQEADDEARAVQYKLNALNATWQRELDVLANSVTFSRMLEDTGSDRWLKMRAYVNALGDTLEYEALLVLDDRQQPLFQQSRNTGLVEVALRQDLHGDWLLNPTQRQFYRVVRAPLWLGREGGHGEILLLRALNNDQLNALIDHEVHLHLTVGGQIYASSLGNLLVGKNYPGGPAHLSPDGLPCRDLALGDARLHIEQRREHMISPTQFALGGLGLTLILSLVFNGVLGSWLRQIASRLDHLSSAVTTFRHQRRFDGEARQTLDRAAGPDDEIGELRRALSDLMSSSQEREEETRAYMQTLDMLEEAVVEVDRDGLLQRSSPAWPILVGSDCESTSLYDCFEAEDREYLRQQIAYLFSGDKQQLTTRLRVSTPQRGGAWLEGRFVPVDTPATRVRGVLRDITQVYLQEKHITHMALHDALTGLPNRVLLEDRLKIAIRMAQRENNRVGVAFIDLDHFKNINDALGHKTGDRLLTSFAGNVHQALRSGDTLARWGGDEFVVLLPDMQELDDIHHVADKLAAVSREPIRIDDNLLPVTFSMGFAVYPDDGDNIDTLLSQADRAMFYAKSQGRNTAIFYADMAKKGLGKKDLYIQTRLASAISNGVIQAWYQPLIDARSHKVVGIETLARWQDPELGWITPATFIPMAENLGLISELGELVTRQALTLGRRLVDAGHDLILSINISKRQLFLPRVTERLLADVKSAGLEPDRVMLEITESVAMSEVEYALDRLKSLHDAGFLLAVDDFGVGYSSLSQLHEMPVNELKIDISFTQRALEPQGNQLIQAIVGMAQALNLATVAEGVEDEHTARVLNELGVDMLQGYHFSRPMPADELEQWLVVHEWRG